MKADHGGNIWKAARQLGTEPEEILDFSSNLNDGKVVIPQGIIGRHDLLVPYPDTDAAPYLGNYSRYVGAPVENILPGPGLTYLIYRFCQAHIGSRAIIVEPSFSEYAGGCEASGINAVRILSDPDMVQKISGMDFDIIFLASPSNPVGDIVAPATLESLISIAEKKGAKVFLDEAFADFASGYDRFLSVRRALESGSLIIGRSLTKVTGMASLRLGFLIGSIKELQRIREVMEPWPLGQDVLEFLRSFDFNQFKNLPETTEKWRSDLIRYMTRNRFRIVGDPRANFISVTLPPEISWKDFHRFLLHRRILVKFIDTGIQSGPVMRVAVKSPEKNAVLMDAITQYLRQRG